MYLLRVKISKYYEELYNLIQVDTINSADCHIRLFGYERRKMIITNRIMLLLRRFIYDSRATEILIINIFILVKITNRENYRY